MKSKILMKEGKQYLPMLAGLLLMLTIFGCASVNPAVTREEMAAEPLTDQVLSAGDVVEIKFLYNQDMNDTQRVRPDGMIRMPLIGEVKAQGKSPDALAKELTALYKDELRKPVVTVTAKTLRNNKVYVGGEVNKPGDIEIPGRLTALEAIGQAGGFRGDSAEPSTVVIIRTRKGKHYGTAINLAEALSGKEMEPFYLRPGDVVYVPKTTIAKVNQWVDQHINRVIPRIPLSFAAVP